MIVRGSTGTAAHGDRQLHFAVYGATPDAVGIVLCSGQESSRVVHEDCGRVPADAKRGGAVGAAGGRRRTRRAYLLVNNRSEDNVPLTAQGLVEMLRG